MDYQTFKISPPRTKVVWRFRPLRIKPKPLISPTIKVKRGKNLIHQNHTYIGPGHPAGNRSAGGKLIHWEPTSKPTGYQTTMVWVHQWSTKDQTACPNRPLRSVITQPRASHHRDPWPHNTRWPRHSHETTLTWPGLHAGTMYIHRRNEPSIV